MAHRVSGSFGQFWSRSVWIAHGVVILVALIVARTGASQRSSVLAEMWHVDKRPSFQLDPATEPRAEFHGITAMFTTARGDVAVGDASTQEIRVFHADGKLKKVLSRRGNGPGEIISLGSISISGDSLFAIGVMPGPSLLHVFDLDSGFKDRTLLLDKGKQPHGIVSALGRLQSGALVVVPGGFSISSSRGVGRISQDSVRVGILPPSGGAVTWLGSFPSAQRVWYELEEGPVRYAATRYPFGPILEIEAIGDTVWLCDSGTASCSVYDAQGVRRRLIPMPIPRRSLSSARLAAAEDVALRRTKSAAEASRVRAQFDPSYRPMLAPVFRRLLAGPNGEAWLEEFAEDPNQPSKFMVFDAAGAHLASVFMPDRFSVHHVSHDRLLGVLTDSDGVETVVGYTLRRR